MTIKKLLATTAIVAVTATGVYIASPSPYAAAANMASGYVQAADAEDHFASGLIGASVYSSADPDGEIIGDVNDLVIAPNGDIDAVVIGVGGFLGLGEKDVAVAFDRLEWRSDESGDAWPVLAATQEELEAAPAFERHEKMTMAPADPARPATEELAVTEEPMTGDPATEKETAMQDEPAVREEVPDETAMTADPNQPAQPAANQEPRTFDPTMISAEQLIDTTVYSAGGENVGEVSDVLLSDAGKIDAIVIDVGGFLGIGEKPVAIAYDDLEIRMDENENLILQTVFSSDQLDAAPEYDETAYRDNPDSIIVKRKS